MLHTYIKNHNFLQIQTRHFSTSVSTNLHGEGWSEEGPLENAGGEDDLVVGLRVVGIGVHRHHVPPTKGENSYRLVQDR